MVLVRWVTWWPAPYWVDRFNRLAKYDGINLEVCFLSAGSNLQAWTIDHTSWKFRHFILNSKYSSSGYFKVQSRFPQPWRLLRPPFHVLVMTYADFSCITAAAICCVMRKPFFLFVPNTKKDMRKGGSGREYIKHLLFNQARGLFATGPAQVQYAMDYSNTPTKIFSIGNPSQNLADLVGISLQKRLEWRQEFHWENQVVMLYVGRLSPEKGLSFLFSALEIVYRRGIRPVLALVGSGPLEDTLRQDASRRSLKVDIKGFCQREQLAKYYRAADVFILPSQSEPWGLVVNEAMEFGLPLILSSHVGCVPVLLHEGENGMTFPFGDEKAMADCIERMARDEDVRRRMGEVSSRIVQSQSIDSWCDAVMGAFKQTLSRGSGRTIDR